MKVLSVLLVLAAASMQAGVQVNRVEDFAKSFTRVAVLPADCPDDVDCATFEQSLNHRRGPAA